MCSVGEMCFRCTKQLKQLHRKHPQGMRPKAFGDRCRPIPNHRLALHFLIRFSNGRSEAGTPAILSKGPVPAVRKLHARMARSSGENVSNASKQNRLGIHSTAQRRVGPRRQKLRQLIRCSCHVRSPLRTNTCSLCVNPVPNMESGRTPRWGPRRSLIAHSCTPKR